MAIALDATSSGTATAGTTVTIAHTCTGANLVLIVVVGGTDGITTPTVTYNAVSMTLVASKNVSNMSSFTFALVGPATGTHNIVVTKGSGDEIGGMGISFTGAGGYSAVNSSDGNSTTASLTVTTATTGAGYVVTGGTTNVVASAAYTGAGAEYADLASASQDYHAAYTAFAAGADVTDSWTFASNKWALSGVEVYELSTSSNTDSMFLVF